MKTNTILIISAVLAMAAAAWYFLRPKAADAAQAKALKADVDSHKETIGAAKFPLKKGSKGIEVLYFQAYLNKNRGAQIVDLDGIFGNETHSAAKEFNNGMAIIQKKDYDAMRVIYYSNLKNYLISKGVKA